MSTARAAAVQESTDLDIGGMTCASCAARVERQLNELPGVVATVNLATERAHVVHPAAVSTADLVAAVDATGYVASLPSRAPATDDGARSLTRRVVLSALLTVPVVLLAMVPALQFDGWQWVSLVLSAPVVAWGAWPFHRAAWTNLRHGATTMDTLVSMGVLAAFGWSLFVVVSGADEHVYLETAAGVTTFILLGRLLETRSRRQAGAALRSLLELGAHEVAVLRDGAESMVRVGDLVVGDRFVVRPGERVATDGVVEDGSSAIDTAVITGEPVPVEVSVGDTVVGGTVNVGGRLVVRATGVGADTQVAQMARLVEEAQNGKAQAQRLADRVSAVFVPAVLVVAALTLAGWLLAGGGWASGLTAAVAVLVVACPCALGLATPTALMVGTGRGAQLGILITGPEVLEQTRRVDTVVLDKTGTVTTGAMALTEVVAAEGEDAAQVLRLAAALEGASEHPIARAIAAGSSARPEVSDFAALPGLGVRGTVEGHAVVVGRPSLLAEQEMPLPAPLDLDRPGTVVAIGWDASARGLLVVEDTVKESSPAAVARLRDLGLRPMLLTGDREAVALDVAARVGIPATDVVAGVLPAAKAEAVERWQSEGRVVAMVGDGVNDAAALAQADLGIAMGTGTDIAIEASDLTLVRGDLRAAADAIRLSRRTLATIKGNLVWAFGYNVAAIPLAAAGLLDPMIAGAAMAFSSVFVVMNSLRLRGFRPLAD